MRGTLLAILVAGGIGLAGTAAVSAAPVINGSALGNAATENQPDHHRAALALGFGRSLALGQPWRSLALRQPWRSLALGQPPLVAAFRL